MSKQIITVAQLKKKLNRYPDNSEVFIYDTEKSEVHPIIECSPFNNDDPYIKKRDNFLTIDFED